MIEALGLTKRYGDTLAVDDLSFKVQPGRVTGFLGPNGAGKSTTMRMILGLDRPDAGEALINGRRYGELARPLHMVGALLDARWVHPRRTARAHLRWLARAGGVPASRVDEVLDLVGLGSAADKRAGGFSLGMSQRLGIAGALLGDPEVLLFDEPVNGLDPEGIFWIRRLMQRLAAQGRTVFVSSHLLSEMALTATEVVVIGRGRLVAQTSIAALAGDASRIAVRVRSPQAGRLAGLLTAAGMSARAVDGGGRSDGLVVRGGRIERVGEIAAQHGIVLHELSVERGSLEQAFMALTTGEVEFAAEVGT